MIHDMIIGTTKSYTRTITEEDILTYGKLTGDLNPAHFDHDYAKTTMFKKNLFVMACWLRVYLVKFSVLSILVKERFIVANRSNF